MPRRTSRSPNSTVRSSVDTSAGTATVSARNLSKAHGSNIVLRDVHLSVDGGTRLGVVGPNGVGKSTLLRVLAGLELPDDGRVVLNPPDATVGYLPQERESLKGETVSGFLARRTGVAGARSRLERASKDLARAAPGAEERYAAALERYLVLGGPDLEARAVAAAEKVGLPKRSFGMRTSELSGGEAAKAALAALLLSRFDIVLLDEPTNDLDFDGLARLEDYLEQRASGFVVVSHDRAFLERVVNSVAEIDAGTHSLTLYRGGWSSYLEERATAQRHAAEDYRVYLAERERLLTRMRRQRQWAVTGVSRTTRRPKDKDKAQRDFRVNRTEKQAAKVRSTERALSRLGEFDKPYEPWSLRMEIPAAGRGSEVVVRLEKAVARRGRFVLGPLDLEISWQERLGVVGRNGSGKTSLLSMILGMLPLETGSRLVGPGTVFGELGQARRRLEPSETLLCGFLAATGMPTSEARSMLAKFDLGPEDVDRSFGTLSQGERTRAELCLLVATRTNCLVLDEPTNHLDLPAIQQLEVALEAWPGTLLLVTHDRALLESVNLTGLIDIEGQPGQFTGGLRRTTLRR